MTTRHGIAHALVLTGLLTLASSVLAQSRPDPAMRCLGIDVGADGKGSTSAKAPVFSARKILDVTLTVALQVAAPVGSDAVRLDFLTPNGNLYQTMDIPVGFPAKESARPMRGYPFPVKVEAAGSVVYRGARAKGVRARLPVAGTSIVTSSLYGVWQVTAAYGNGEPCTAKFSIQP